MTVSVKMPQLGESVTEGTVTRWLKQEGETVQEDEPLLEVSTDKVDTEVPSPASGVLQKILVAEDETVDVGSELATIGDAAEGGGEQPAPQEDAAPAPQTEQPQTEQTSAEQPSPEQPAPDLSQPDVPSSDAPAPAEEPAPQPEAEPAPAAAASPAGGTEVPMPALGESVTEGTVTRWLKQVGDDVAADEPLLEVSTDKVDTEIPSPASGTLLEIRVEEDATVDVGAVLAIIGDKSAAPVEQAAPAPAETAAPTAPAQEAPPAEQQAPEPEPAAEATAPPAPETQEQVEAGGDIVPDAAAPAPSPQSDLSGEQAAPPVESTDTDGSGERAYVTPLVRKLATEHGVDLSALTGTGVGGRIRKQDVLDAAAKAAEAAKPEPEPEPEPEAAAAPVAAAAPSKPAAATAPAGDQASLRGTTVKMTRLRKLIARRMVESLQTAAQLTTVVEVDVTQVARLRDRVKKEFAAREGVKLSFLPFFALAAVEALKVHPVVNSTLDADEGTITYPDTENLGIAVDSNRGLVVPVIHNAGDLNLAGLARQIADLAEKTRGGTASPDDLVGGTFTITNTGSRGALFDTPIVNQPQSAILGTGAVVKRPAVINDPNLGEIIAVRSTVYLALSYDHRIVDGADAARFLATVKERLEAGAFESDLGL